MSARRRNELEPGYTCPLVDDLITSVEDIEEPEGGSCTKQEALTRAEKVRDANSELRAWGRACLDREDAMERERDDMERDLLTCQSTRDHFERERDEYREDVTRLRVEVERLEEERDRLQNELTQLQEKFEAQDNELTGTYETIYALRAERLDDGANRNV